MLAFVLSIFVLLVITATLQIERPIWVEVVFLIFGSLAVYIIYAQIVTWLHN